MNVLKTAAEQVKEFGKYLYEKEYTTGKAEHYRLDTVTEAIVYTDKRNKEKQVTFRYMM